FSGPGITGNDFDPSTAGVGTHTITYTITDGNGCSATTSETVIVSSVPDATFSGLSADYCVDAGSVTLNPAQSGGTFSGPGITGNDFDPNAAGVGTHTITYTITDGNGCSATETKPVTVNALPDASFNGLPSAFCVDASGVTITPTIAGGTFSGAGISGNNFVPGNAGVGSHTITYTITVNGCTSTNSKTVNVNPTPDASFSGLNTSVTFCSAGNDVVTLVPNVGGGTFSGPGVSGNQWEVENADLGANIITYEITQNGCTSSLSQVVEVLLSPNASFNNLDDYYCESHDPVDLTPVNPGGVFTATSGLSSNKFYPSIADLGVNVITYSITGSNGCSNTSSDTLIIRTSPLNTVSSSDTVLTADAVGTNLDYQWIDCETGFDVPGEVSRSFNVGQTGSYKVEINDGFCVSTSTCLVVYFADLASELNESLIKVYPNPNKGVFKLETYTSLKVEVVNSLGQLVYQDVFSQGVNTINLGSSIETGMYLIRLTDEYENVTYKNVVIRN
ncbi:hypothetical protein CW751_12785, partial [Brumimicrobium salinarum]